MNNIPEAIAERREHIGQLEAEIAQLEAVADLFGRYVKPAPRPKQKRVKPPPAVRRAKPVRAEKSKPKPAPVLVVKPKKQPRTQPGDATFAACGHPRTKENIKVTGVGRAEACRTCNLAQQKAYYARTQAKGAKAAPAKKVAVKPPPAMPLGWNEVDEVDEPAVAPTPPPPPPPKPAPFKAVATAWAGQCPMLDSDSGKRCSLPMKHPLPHNAQGRTFSAAAAINLAAMGGSVRAAGP